MQEKKKGSKERQQHPSRWDCDRKTMGFKVDGLILW